MSKLMFLMGMLLCGIDAVPIGTINAFFWTANSLDSLKYGCYGYSKTTSVITSETELRYTSVIGLPRYEWWNAMFPSTRIKTEIAVSRRIPASVTRCPNHFRESEWITGVTHVNGDGRVVDSIRFIFPMLPASIKYGRYDYFTVTVNDTLDLEFYGAGDSIMVGTFVDRRPSANGALNIIARNAIIVELTNGNNLRIKSVRFNGAFNEINFLYLGYDLNLFKSNQKMYGFDILKNAVSVSGIRNK